MSQRLIIAIGISGFAGLVLLIALNVMSVLQRGPTASPSIAARPSATAPAATPGRTSPGSSASPTARTPVPSASGAGSPAPSGEPGRGEAAGTLTLSIAPPVDVRLTVAATCTWAPDQPLRVARVTSGSDPGFAARGEPLVVEIDTDDATTPFLLARRPTDGAQVAAYGRTTATRQSVRIATEGDRTRGTVTFRELGTNEATIPVELLPLPRADYARPLGGNDDARRITGEAAWTCEGAPVGFEPGPPEPSPSATPRLPTVALAGAGRTRDGVATCPRGTAQDGTPIEPQCDHAWPAPDAYPGTLVVPRATRVVLSTSEGWRIADWKVQLASLADVEATRGKPERDTVVFEGSEPGAPVRSLFFRSPGRGTWIVRATLTLDGPGDAALQSTTWYFLVRST